MNFDHLSNPHHEFDQAFLKDDLELTRKQSLYQMFTRRRVVFFMDGYRYAHDAAQKRWNIHFTFYESGNEPVKRVFQSQTLNKEAADLWLQSMSKDPAFGLSLVEELQQVVETGKRLAQNTSNLKLSHATVSKALLHHLDWWIQFFEIAFLWFAVDPIKIETDKQIRENWHGSLKQLEHFLEHVYRPMQLPQSSIEQRDLVSLASLRGKKLKLKLTEHWKKYRHLSLHDIDDEYFDLEYYRDRVHALRDESEYRKQKELFDAADHEIEEANNLLSSVPISEELKERVEFVRWFMFLRTESIDCMMFVNGAYRKIFDYLAKQFTLPIDGVLNMTYKEINDSLHSSVLTVPKEQIKERSTKGYAYYIGHKHAVLVTGDGIEKLQKACIPEIQIQKVKELKGQTAFEGKVIGRARVITDRRNSHELQEGEILVTTMTSPEFVPAMKRSSGIITNEGGVLCHAAIMSRELRKPCIIGTKIATDVIQTGQVITLDANSGIITIK